MSESKRKILYLCADTGIPYWGTKGGSIHMREFVSNLQKQGYDITVVARGADANGHQYNSVLYFDLPPLPDSVAGENSAAATVDNKISAEMNLFDHNNAVETFISMLHSQSNFDLIYERYSLFCQAGLKFARANGLPFTLEVNAPLVVEAAEYRGLAQKDLAISVAQHLFEDADHIISVSDEVAGYIKSVAPGAAVSVIPNGVTVEQFTNSDGLKDIDLSFDRFDKSDFVVGFVGSLKPWHGVEILIDSFADLSKNEIKDRLLVVGGKGKLKSELKQKCRELGLKGRVKFTGSVEHETIPAFLEMADVLVAPYPDLNDFYFSALKIFEYMAAGKAIVASSIGQIEEILVHEQTALLVPPGDAVALRDALLRLKNDPGLRKKLGENARIEAVAKHTWNSRLKTVSRIFEDLMAGAKTESGKL
ncbi:MAG: glycosyltransferase family 4 protein [candidate division Zixibacteria bacterium]